MREFRPTPPTGGSEPEDPWSLRPERPQAPVGSPSWGAPSSGYAHPQGTTVLVLGILSVVVMPLLGPFAWVMGHRSLREVDSSGVPASNRQMLVGGMVTGIIGTVFLGLAVLAFVAFVALFTTTVVVGGV